MLNAKIEYARADADASPGDAYKITLNLTRAEFAELIAAVELAESCGAVNGQFVSGVCSGELTEVYRAAKVV